MFHVLKIYMLYFSLSGMTSIVQYYLDKDEANHDSGMLNGRFNTGTSLIGIPAFIFLASKCFWVCLFGLCIYRWNDDLYFLIDWVFIVPYIEMYKVICWKSGTMRIVTDFHNHFLHLILIQKNYYKSEVFFNITGVEKVNAEKGRSREFLVL